MNFEYFEDENGIIDEIIFYTGESDSDHWPITVKLKGENLKILKEKLKMSPDGGVERHILVLEEVISEINNIIMDEVEISSKSTDKGTYRLIELTRVYEKLKSIRNYFV